MALQHNSILLQHAVFMQEFVNKNKMEEIQDQISQLVHM